MQQDRILELDGVRGLAIIAVMVFHLAQYHPAQPDLLSAAIDLGWIGVDLFFVLSGFLITGVLLAEKRSPRYLRNFYLRRALRILPLYYAAVFCFFHLELPLAHHFHALRSVNNDGELLYWLQLSNWRSAFGELASSPVGPFWSLAIEEQFYIVWPFVVLWTGERGLTGVCLGLAAISAALRLVPQFQWIAASNTEFLYRLTPFRLEPLCYGALLASLSMRAQLSGRLQGWLIGACISGALIFLLAVLLGGSATKYTNPLVATYGFTGIDWVCGGLVGLAIVRRGRAGFAAFLRNSTLRRFGQLSYAMYVLHIQVAILVTLATAKLMNEGLMASFVNISVGIACTYVLALCSWRWIEAPLLSLKGRLAPSATPYAVAEVKPPLPALEGAAGVPSVSGQRGS
jgi:peptidoglycan/LPS O-acetylase OafA/YrhL